MAKKAAKKESEGFDNKFDISKHILVPQHELCSQKEKAAVLAQYGVDIAHMPRISAHDPAIAHLDASAGDLIKITRASSTAGQTLFYRVVVE